MQMRNVVAVILIAVRANAGSQEVELSDKEVAVKWLQLSTMASGESEKAGVEHLKHHGISDEGAAALTKYMKQADTDFNELASSFRVSVCQHQQELRDGGQEALAQFVEAHVAEENALRREQVEAAERLLPDQDRLHLHDLLTNREHHGPRVGIHEGNSIASLVRTGMIKVDDAIKRSECGSIA